MATTQADPSGGGTSSLAPFRHAIQAPNSRVSIWRLPVTRFRQPFAVVSSRPTTLQTLWDYGLRFDIEENFWMTSRIAFQLEASGLRHRSAGSVDAVLAVATLFLDFTRYRLGTRATDVVPIGIGA